MRDERMLYPLKFFPVFKDKIWGGDKIKTVLGFNYGDLPNCGEAWMLSGIEDSESIVSNGFLEGNTLTEVLEVYMGDLVGEECFDKYGLYFPLLIKWLDTQADLSVQVHPDNALAMEREGSLGKDELWYIVDVEPLSSLICGFARKTTQYQYLESMKKKDILSLLSKQDVNKGDAYNIPSGTIHGLGAGLLLAEIQQASDITYRLYDWDRTGENGISRELHTDLGLAAIKFENKDAGLVEYSKIKNFTNPLCHTPSFKVNYLSLDTGLDKNISEQDIFIVYMCTKGNGVLKVDTHALEIKVGEVVMVPAISDFVSLYPDVNGMDLLEIYLD